MIVRHKADLKQGLWRRPFTAPLPRLGLPTPLPTRGIMLVRSACAPWHGGLVTVRVLDKTHAGQVERICISALPRRSLPPQGSRFLGRVIR